MSSREALRELSVALGGFVGEQQGGSSVGVLGIARKLCMPTKSHHNMSPTVTQSLCRQKGIFYVLG